MGPQEPSLGSRGHAFGSPIDQSGRQAKALKHHFRVLGILAPSKRQTRFHRYGQCFRPLEKARGRFVKLQGEPQRVQK